MLTKEYKLEELLGAEDVIEKRWQGEAAKFNAPARRQLDMEQQDRKKVIQNRISKQEIVNQEISSEITKHEAAIERLSLIPAEHKQPSYLPQLRKQLKE